MTWFLINRAVRVLTSKTEMKRFVLLVFVAAAMVVAATPVSAQSRADADAGIGGSDAAAGSSDRALGAKSEKIAKEEAEDDGTAQFKQSASVQWLGHRLGVSAPAMYWLAVVINFAFIALGVMYFSRLHLPTAFRNRTDAIRRSMDEAKAASDEAKTRLAAIEARLGRLDADISAMKAKAEQDGAAEEAGIRASAEDDKQKIVEAAAQEIDVAAKGARRELAAYAADLAVQMARQRIQVDVPADQALIRGFAASLAKEPQ
jgi:F-type H+-transporting ATPase subunit b